MSEPSVAAPAPELLHGQRRRFEWRRAGPVAASAAFHLIVLAWLVLPRVPALTPADAPVDVDIVTPRDMASLERSVSSSQPPSSSAPASSSAASSADPSSTASSAVMASSAEALAASSRPLPAGKPVVGKAGRLVVPVGDAGSSSEEQSSEASSAASEIASAASDASSSESASAASEAPASALTAASGIDDGANASTSTQPPPPVGGGALHPAKHFYLADMLRAPGLAQVRETLKTLPPERRLAQTCMIEALGQAGHAGYAADIVVPNAFAPPAASGQTYSASGGAVRSDGSWYRIAYDCTLSPDMGKVTSFSFHIGADVTADLTARLGGKN